MLLNLRRLTTPDDRLMITTLPTMQFNTVVSPSTIDTHTADVAVLK